MSLPASQTAAWPQRLVLKEETVAAIVQALADQIGPVARVVVRREISRAGDLADLPARLLANIDDELPQREFQSAMRDFG